MEKNSRYFILSLSLYFLFFLSFFFARTSNSCVSFSHGIYFPSSFRCSSLSVQTTKFVSFTSVDLHNLIDKSVQNQETHLYSWLMHAPRIQRNKKVLQYPIDKRYGKSGEWRDERETTNKKTDIKWLKNCFGQFLLGYLENIQRSLEAMTNHCKSMSWIV